MEDQREQTLEGREQTLEDLERSLARLEQAQARCEQESARRIQERLAQAQARQEQQHAQQLEQRWASIKDKVGIIKESHLREMATRTGLTASPGWAEWERNWQRQEGEWKSFMKSELDSLMREFRQRDKTGITTDGKRIAINGELVMNAQGIVMNGKPYHSLADAANAEKEWRQTREKELEKKLREIQLQKHQELQGKYDQFVATEKAAKEIREFEQEWEAGKEKITLTNIDAVRENVSRAGLTASPQWPEWERQWQEEEKAWKSLVRGERLNLLKEFHKRNLEMTSLNADEVKTENQWRQAQREGLSSKLREIGTQRIQVLQDKLDQLATTERIRIQREDIQIAQFFAEAATDAVTDYLKTLSKDKLNQLAVAKEVQVQKEDVQIAQFFTEAATDVVTDYLEALSKDRHLYEYTNGLITKITDPLGQSIHQEWYPVGDTSPGAYPGSLKKYTDKRGLVTQFEYDTKGNLIEKAVIGDVTGDKVSYETRTKFAYNDNNLLTSIIDPYPFGNEITISYEDSNYPQLPTYIEGNMSGWFSTTIFSVSNTYYKTGNDGKGLLQRQILAAGTPEEATVEYTYNEEGLLIHKKQITGTSDPDVVMQFEYNSNGELTKQTDELGITHYLHDLLKKQIMIERRNKADELLDRKVMHYGFSQYDIANLAKVSSSESRVQVTYDAIGQMLSRTYRDHNDSSKIYSEKFTREPGEKIATYTNPEGDKTKYFHTPYGKLYRQENPDGTTQEWRYRLDGRLEKEILSDGSYWKIDYDDINSEIICILQDSTHEILGEESYSFDQHGNMISYTDREGKTIAREYDKLNRLIAEIVYPEEFYLPPQRTEIAYNGNTITITNAQGEKGIITKDALGRTTSILVQDANNEKVSETKYIYSADKISVTETKGSESTTTVFDALGNTVWVNRVDSNEGFWTRLWNTTWSNSDSRVQGDPAVVGGLMERFGGLVIPLAMLGKQVTAIDDARRFALPMIGVSMGLGGIGTMANKLGLKSVGNTFDKISVNMLQNVADRLSATNEGPLGRVFDTLTRSTTGNMRPFFGHNQPFLADWITENLPTRIVYPPDSIQVRDMVESPNVQQAIDEYYAAGAPIEGATFHHETFEAFLETIVNPRTANWKSTAMQVGGYRNAKITNNGDGTMTIRITNVAGAKSFFYHLLPNLPGKTGPMHNVEQVFEWTIPIDPNRLPQTNQ